MSIDDLVRDALGDRAEHQSMPALPSIDAIAEEGARRTRRNRAVTGVGVLLLVAGLLAAVGQLNRQSSDLGVAAHGDGARSPFLVSATDDGFIGLAESDTAPVRVPTEPPESRELLLVTSRDGLQWSILEPVPDDARYSKSVDRVLPIEMDVHDDEIALVSVGLEDDVAVTITSTRAADGIWTHVEHEIDVDLRDDEVDRPLILSAVSVIARDAGVLVRLALQDDPFLPGGADFDPSLYCNVIASDRELRTRRCGEAEFEVTPREMNLNPRNLTAILFVPADGGQAVLVEPWDGASWQALQIYGTADGFGISGRTPRESVDGVSWTDLDNRFLVKDARIVARGDERFALNPNSPQRISPNDPVWDAWYSDQGGDDWQRVELPDRRYDIVAARFDSVIAGDAGWVVSVWHPGAIAAGLDGPEPFSVESRDGSVFEGTTPFGPAELRDPDGDLLERWDHFEVRRPSASGATFEAGALVVGTEDAGRRFDPTAWYEASGDGVSTELLFSPDARNWFELVELPGAIGSMFLDGDEVLVQRYQGAIVPGRFERIPLPEIDRGS